MPLRDLKSSILRWPDAETVVSATEAWVGALRQQRDDVLAVALIGSYARGDWGVGSDLDLVIIIAQSEERFWERGRDFDLSQFPVPAEALIFTLAEWQARSKNPDRFFNEVANEALWLYARPGVDLGIA